MPSLTFKSDMPVPAEELFAWHERPGAFMRLAPPWVDISLKRFEGLRDGQQAEIGIGAGPARITWVAEHQDYIPGRQFVDVQVSGPFKRWKHTHRMEPLDDHRSTLTDAIEYALPMGALGQLAGGAAARKQIEYQFAYRHRVTQKDLTLHHRYNPEGRTLRIAITGSRGLIGRSLVPFLTTGGHEVVRLVRREDQAQAPDAVLWNPETGTIDAEALEGLDAVIHLAGEPVFAFRWSDDKKRRIYDSRVMGTQRLAEALAALDAPPKAFLSASAIGYYGGEGDAVRTEAAPPGEGFLAKVVRDWEAATQPATEAGIRTAQLRIGIVLSPQGGALAQMLPAFKAGLGGPVGDKAQMMAWVALDDILGGIYHVLWTHALEGPVNLVGPQAVTMEAYAKTLAKVLRRPALFRVPATALKAVLGEVAEEVVMMSTNCVPTKLLDSGYAFMYDTLEAALRHQLGKTLTV